VPISRDRDRFERTACLARSSSPLRSTIFIVFRDVREQITAAITAKHPWLVSHAIVAGRRVRVIENRFDNLAQAHLVPTANQLLK
jgi:hypothetical protein